MADRRQIDTRSAAKLVASLVGHDNVISISRSILELLGGDYPAAVLLCQSIYWQSKVEAGKGGTKDGYFWKSMSDWHREIAISEYQVRAATKRLLKAGVLETTTRKAWSDQAKDMVPTVHYRVGMDNLLELLLSLVSSESTLKKLKSPLPKNCGIDSEKTAATINTETTFSETTTTTATPPPEPESHAGGDNDSAKMEEYINLAAQDYCRSRGFGPVKLAGVAASIRRRLTDQGGMAAIDQQQLIALLDKKKESLAMRARVVAQAEIIHLPLVDDPPVWRQARETLRTSIPINIYSLWIDPLACLGQEGATLVLGCPDPYFCNFLQDNYLQEIESALQEAGLTGGKVRLIAHPNAKNMVTS
ncbi:MAG: DnaA N-terminal domain-containing protein [Desulfurivibrionaceae bacterium]